MALFLSWSFLLYFDQLGVIHTLWWASCFHYFQKIIYCYFEVCACCSWNFSQSLSYVLYLTTIQLNIYPIFLICTWLQLFGVFLVGIPMEMDSRRNGVKNNILNQLGKAQLSQSVPVAYSSEKMPDVKIFSLGAQSRQRSDAIMWFKRTRDPKTEFDDSTLETILNSEFSETIKNLIFRSKQSYARAKTIYSLILS